jgi:hypothetical protein
MKQEHNVHEQEGRVPVTALLHCGPTHLQTGKGLHAQTAPEVHNTSSGLCIPKSVVA